MGKTSRLSGEEKERRLRLLQEYDQWSDGMEAPTPSGYCAATGTDQPYLASCVKWRQSLLPRPARADGNGFVRLGTAKGPGGEPVRVSVGGVSIEVGPNSSREALAIVIAALGAAHVL